MTTAFTQPNHTEPKRDRWGRPLITPLDGGKETAYTRVSTLAKAIDDTTNLTKWKCRKAVKGAALRPDLAALAQALDPDVDKGKFNDLVEQAMEAAGSGQAANMGTALHAFLEWADTDGFDITTVPTEQRQHVANYVAARDAAGLVPMGMERFVVCDELQAAGTFDRLYYHPVHGIVVGDIKTGSSAAAFPHATAMQVAVYAHSVLYDVESGRRTPIPNVNLSVGVLVHLDQNTAECQVHALDIARGWEAARLATQVSAWRKTKGIAQEWS